MFFAIFGYLCEGEQLWIRNGTGLKLCVALIHSTVVLARTDRSGRSIRPLRYTSLEFHFFSLLVKIAKSGLGPIFDMSLTPPTKNAESFQWRNKV